MKHIDLFSGIGGFALATEMVWDSVEHVFCDNEPFSQAIIKKHWPQSQIYGDIRTLTADAEYQRITRKFGNFECSKGETQKGGKKSIWSGKTRNSNTESIDLLTGGFPCQPFSQAGRRLGTEDDRHLWPEMLRVIREFHPRWIIGENVGGLVTWNEGMVLEQVQSDLEGEGYEVQAFIIPACALNAPHRRDRVWIVAHTKYEQEGNSQRRGNDEGSSIGIARSVAFGVGTKRKRLEGRKSQKRTGQHGFTRGIRGNEAKRVWEENWSSVATRLCTLDDGLPGGLARPRGWRNAALKGAGNAIVPQVAAEIMTVIKQVDSL